MIIKICKHSIIAIFISLYLDPALSRDMSCEEAREKLIAPLRQEKIDECKRDSNNDPVWCERFYSTYGDATPRPGGGVYPRMFNDIPECKETK